MSSDDYTPGSSRASETVGSVPPGTARARPVGVGSGNMDRVAIFRRLRKSAGMTLPEMAALLRVPVRSLTRGDAAALDRAAKKLLGLRPSRSRGLAGSNARAHR